MAKEEKVVEEGTSMEDVARVASARAEKNAAETEEQTKKKAESSEENAALGKGKVDGEQAPTDKAQDDESTDGGDEEEAGENTPGDDLLERAIRAGMSMKEAKSVSDKDALASIVGRLEGAKGKPDEKPADEKPKSVLDKLPDLGSDAFEGYPTEIISALKAQQEVIRELHESLKSATAKSGEATPASKGTDSADGNGQAKEKSDARKHRVVNQPRSTSGQFVADAVGDSYENRRSAAVEEVRAMMTPDE